MDLIGEQCSLDASLILAVYRSLEDYVALLAKFKSIRICGFIGSLESLISKETFAMKTTTILTLRKNLDEVSLSCLPEDGIPSRCVIYEMEYK